MTTLKHLITTLLLITQASFTYAQGITLQFSLENTTSRSGTVIIGKEGPALTRQGGTAVWQLTTSKTRLIVGMQYPGIFFPCHTLTGEQLVIYPALYEWDTIHINFLLAPTAEQPTLVCECRGSVCESEPLTA